jgi:preprotein translocase subunit SecE
VVGIWNTKEADHAKEIWPTEHSHSHITIVVIIIIIIIIIIHIITIFTWHHSDF